MVTLRHWAMLCGLAGLLACAGCVSPQPPDPRTIVSQDRLVREYNANAAAVPRVWARAKIEISIKDEKGSRHNWGSASPLASPNGLLLLNKSADRLGSRDFMLEARESSVPLFRLGSNVAESVYYFWYKFGDRGAAWWGRQQYAGAAGVKGMPLDPNQLLAVLAVCELPEDYTRIPAVAVTMRTEAPPFAYVATYMDRQPVSGRIIFRREMYFTWNETGRRQLFLVHFFGPDGRRIMTATMKDYEPIAGTQTASGKPSMMPTDIEIVWPEQGSHIRIVLVSPSTKPVDAGAFSYERYVPKDVPAEQVDRDVKGDSE